MKFHETARFFKRKCATIRMKVTLWYAFFMVLLIAISLLLIGRLSRNAMLVNQKANLIETVNDGIKEINSFGEFEYFENGVYILVYDENETFITGIVPDGFSASQPLLQDHMQTIETGDQILFVYDKLVDEKLKIAGTSSYWMRGITPQSSPDPNWLFIISNVSGFMPALALLACVVGYFITGRAFRPVRKIQETAQKIADSDELSLRIGLPEGEDEIAKLGKTVDHMLDKLQKSFEKEKQFTSDASHELRTPLAVILNESEYALTSAVSPEEMQESLAVINRQADRMTVLINRLLFFSRSDSTSLLLNRENFEVLPVIHELAQDYGVLAEPDGITISVADSPAANLSVYADQMLFTRSLSNLIQNAVNYGKPGGHISIAVSIDIKFSKMPAAISAADSRKNRYLVIEVSDDGPGISAENLDKIWDRFYQVEESRNKSMGNGMGLGLSMVKTIVEKHGGYVTVDSVLTKGSIFAMFYPLQ